MPQIEFSKVYGVFLKDQKFTKQEGEYVTEFAKQGLIRREDLFDSHKAIAAAPGTKVGLKVLEDFFDKTAKGLERSFHLADPRLIAKLAANRVTTPEALLARARKPVDRSELAHRCGVEVKAIESLASQADLQRVAGLDKKVARALVEANVKSVAQLATLSVEVLSSKLAKRLPASAVPKSSVIQGWRSSAKALPKALEFGSGKPTERLAAWAALSAQVRAERVYAAGDYGAPADPLLSAGRDRTGADPVSYLKSVKAPQSAINTYSSELRRFNDELEEWQGDMDGGYDKSSKPEIQEFNVGDKVVVTAFSFSANDGSEDLYIHLYYDHLAKKFTGVLTGNTANGSADDQWDYY